MHSRLSRKKRAFFPMADAKFSCSPTGVRKPRASPVTFRAKSSTIFFGKSWLSQLPGYVQFLANRDRHPHLYIAVLTVLRDFNLPMFDREDARKIEDEIAKLERDYDGDGLAELLVEFVPSEIPARYKIALLKQLCGRYYSLAGTSVGTVLP
jgi:hypothetical protein